MKRGGSAKQRRLLCQGLIALVEGLRRGERKWRPGSGNDAEAGYQRACEELIAELERVRDR